MSLFLKIDLDCQNVQIKSPQTSLWPHSSFKHLLYAISQKLQADQVDLSWVTCFNLTCHELVSNTKMKKRAV